MTTTTATVLVCPECGSDRTATLERATIWQPCRFELGTPTGLASDFGDEHFGSFRVFAEFDGYDSEDVGDTDTVGYVCRACLTTWEGEVGELPEFPFRPLSA